MNRDLNRGTGTLAAVSILACLLAIVMTGCGGGKTPKTFYYTLQLPSTPSSVSTGPTAVVGVAPFRVDPPYDDDRILYRIGDGSSEVGFYAYHRWAAPLGRVLPILAADALGGAGGVESIEPADSGRRYRGTLHGRILALEEIDLPDGQIVRLRLSLTLRDRDGTDLWSSNRVEEGRTNTDRVGDIVDEMGAVLAKAFAQVRDDLAAASRALGE